MTSSIDGLRADRAGSLEGPKAATGAVVVERGRVDDADAGEQAEAGLAGLRHGGRGRWRLGQADARVLSWPMPFVGIARGAS